MRMLGLVVAGAALLCAGGAVAQAPVKPFKVMFTNSGGQPAGTAKIGPGKGGEGVKITLDLKNLPFGPHGVHIHEHGSCTGPDFKDAGGHFNPTAKHHGYENPQGHHAGDTPQSIQIGEDHSGSITFTLPDLTLDPMAPNSIFAGGGTSIVVHEKADDQKTDPSGNSGNRIACAVIKQP